MNINRKLAEACSKNDVEEARRLIELGANWFVYGLECCIGVGGKEPSMDTARLMIQMMGKCIDVQDLNCLMDHACASDDKIMCQFLFENGANECYHCDYIGSDVNEHIQHASSIKNDNNYNMLFFKKKALAKKRIDH